MRYLQTASLALLIVIPALTTAASLGVTELEVTPEIESRALEADGWIEIYDTHREGSSKALETLLGGGVPTPVAVGFESDLFIQTSSGQVTARLVDYAAFRGSTMVDYGANCADWAKVGDDLSITFKNQTGLYIQFDGRARAARHLVYRDALSDELTQKQVLSEADCDKAYETRMLYSGKLRLRLDNETLERDAVLQYILYH
jgi:hypothetical protein